MGRLHAACMQTRDAWAWGASCTHTCMHSARDTWAWGANMQGIASTQCMGVGCNSGWNGSVTVVNTRARAHGMHTCPRCHKDAPTPTLTQVGKSGPLRRGHYMQAWRANPHCRRFQLDTWRVHPRYSTTQAGTVPRALETWRRWRWKAGSSTQRTLARGSQHPAYTDEKVMQTDEMTHSTAQHSTAQHKAWHSTREAITQDLPLGSIRPR
jgi:hypothetical protein